MPLFPKALLFLIFLIYLGFYLLGTSLEKENVFFKLSKQKNNVYRLFNIIMI